jgi:hypothetical protein
MFSLPQPSDAVINGFPVVQLSEDAEVVRALITVLYPIPSEIPSSYSGVLALLAAAQKYDMSAIQSSIRAEVSRRNSLSPTGSEVFVYAIASKNRLLTETQTAARLTLHHPLTFEFLGNGLRQFEGWALRDLASFRKSCRDSLVSCLESFLDIQNGPSKFWNDCSKLNPPRQSSSYYRGPEKVVHALPSWLRDLFRQQIRELEQNFTDPLPKPSSIREKYLGALWVHIRNNSDGCTCLTTHAFQGEKYCLELEEKLAGALDKAGAAFTFREIS